MDNSSNPNPPATSASAAVAEGATNPAATDSAPFKIASMSASLKSLNKSSYKISKAPTKSPSADTARALASSEPIGSVGPSDPLPPALPQPPVYNIDKNDFREVVQKLTGSPAHVVAPSPPSMPPPAAPTFSRLQRIRPPPLAQLAPAPGPWAGVRPLLSPLPPLPAVGVAVESPITAYMRQLRGAAGAAPPPSSPLGFGCGPPLPSPRTSTIGPPTSPSVLLSSPRLGKP